MRLLYSFRLFLLVAALTLAVPMVVQARDGGHGGGGHGGGWHGGGGHGGWHGGGGWHRGGWGGRGYWGGGWGWGYGYPYYGYGWDYPYYGDPYYGTYYGRAVYSASTTDNLAVDVQRALKRRGYYAGAVDGQIGAGTRGALRNFQAEHRLAVTGRIDNATLRALGI